MACSPTARAVHRAAQLFAHAEERTQPWKPWSSSPVCRTSNEVGGGWREARHQSHAETNDITTESSCKVSRMRHPLHDGRTSAPPWRLAQPGARVLASAPC